MDTQRHLNILDITNDLVLLKDGSASLVLKTSAVNFGLLSQMEQVSIIDAFAQMLNSLSAEIQIVIHSQRLDISSYLSLLDRAQRAQTNPLLSNMMLRYKEFIQTTIKEQEVLDKQFYVVIPVSYLELGIGKTTREERLKKIKTILNPRRDQLLRQLARVGLKATQLSTEDLIKLFFNIYNQPANQPVVIEPVKLATPQPPARVTTPQPVQMPPRPQAPPPIQTPVRASTSPPASSNPTSRHHPFVVEELTDSL